MATNEPTGAVPGQGRPDNTAGTPLDTSTETPDTNAQRFTTTNIQPGQQTTASAGAEDDAIDVMPIVVCQDPAVSEATLSQMYSRATMPQDPKSETVTLVATADRQPKVTMTWKSRVVELSMPIYMVILAFLGLFGALGHHLYYQGLHGQQAQNAEWPTRFGIALAFFVKLTLVASVEIAFKQHAWVAVKGQSFKLSTIDAIFSACNNCFQLLSLEYLTKASLSAITAALVWALPLCAIASPSTLTTRNAIQTHDTTCTNVPFLDLSTENGFGLYSDDDALSGLCFWNIRDDGRYIYASPTMELQRVFQLTMLSTTGPLQPTSPCPSGTSCAYNMTLSMPTWHCEDREDFGGLSPAPFNRSQLVPEGKLVYASYSSVVDDDDNGVPPQWETMSSSDPNLGVFTELPSLWVGWVTDPSNPKPHISECALYNASITYKMAFAAETVTMERTGEASSKILLSSNTSIGPTDKTYQQVSGYYAAGYLYRKLLAGNVTYNDNNTWFIANSDITQTNLLDPVSLLPTSGENFTSDLRDRFEAIFLSMLTDKTLHALQNASMPCSVSATVLAWNYASFWLSLSYGLAVGLTLVSLLAGLHSFHVNGYSADVRFSTFLVTTRSADADELARGHCLGRFPVAKEVLRTRLRFGEIKQGAHMPPHAAFAFPSQVVDIDLDKKKYV